MPDKSSHSTAPVKKPTETTSTPPIVAVPAPKRRLRFGHWLGIILVILALAIIALGWAVLRTTWVYNWAPFVQTTAGWSHTLSEEHTRLSANQLAMDHLEEAPLTPGEILIQKRELDEWKKRNADSTEALLVLQPEPFVPEDVSMPTTVTRMGQAMHDDAAQSTSDIEEEAYAIQALTLAANLNDALNAVFDAKGSDVFAGSDAPAIIAAATSTRKILDDSGTARDTLERALSIRLDTLHAWQDKQAEYIDQLKTFYELRSSAISTLKNQEIALKDLEAALAAMDPYADLDRLDRTVLTNARNTLRDVERRRRDTWGAMMRRWRWWSPIRSLMS